MTTTTLVAHVRSLADAPVVMRALAGLPDVSRVEMTGLQSGTIYFAVECSVPRPLDCSIRDDPSLDWRMHALDNIISVWLI